MDFKDVGHHVQDAVEWLRPLIESPGAVLIAAASP